MIPLSHNSFSKKNQDHSLIFFADDGNAARQIRVEDELDPSIDKDEETAESLALKKRKAKPKLTVLDGGKKKKNEKATLASPSSQLDHLKLPTGLLGENRPGVLSLSNLNSIHEILYDSGRLENADAQNPYTQFRDMLRDKKFPLKDQGKTALRLLKALHKGNDAEKAYAKNFLKTHSKDSAAPLDDKGEAKLLNDLKILAIEDTDELDDNMPQTSAKFADIKGRLTMISKHIENIESETGNYTPEPFPENVEQKYQALHGKLMSHFEEAKEKEGQLAEAKSRLLDPTLKKDEKARLESQIKNIEQSLIAIDAQIDQICDNELRAFEVASNAYFQRSLERHRMIEDFEHNLGISLSRVKTIKLMNEKQQWVNWGISKISFEKRDDMTDEHPGVLMVAYADEHGKLQPPISSDNFTKLINRSSGHEELKAEDLDEAIQEKTAYIPLAQKQIFENHLKQTFEVEQISREGLIVVQHMTKDGKKKGVVDILTLGLFKKLLIRGNYHLKIDDDQFDEAIKNENFKKLDVPEVGKKNAKIVLGRNFLTRRSGWIASKKDQNGELEFVIGANAGELPPDVALMIGHTDLKNEYNVSKETLLELMSATAIKNGGTPIAEMATNKMRKYARMLPAELHGTANKLIDKIDANKHGGGGGGDSSGGGGGSGGHESAPDSGGSSHEGGGGGSSHGGEKPSAKKESHDESGGGGTETTTHDDHGDDSAGHDEGGEIEKLGPSDEGLLFSQIHKFGGMDEKDVGYFKALWGSTKLLSFSDVWAMGKAMYEYWTRRWHRREKDKFSSVAHDIPFFAPEMQRIKEAAEHEEVNHFKEAMEHWGIFHIQHRLHETGNKDEFKACMEVLTEKGQMNWDDIKFWTNLNKILAMHGSGSLAVPIPANGDPATMVSEIDQRTGRDFVKPGLDGLWGEGTFNSWYQKNNSTYDSNAKSYYSEGDELEGVEGEHGRRLKILLEKHKQGEYVNPHEYEGLILHSIERGKSNMQVKIYYMIAGVAAENHEGRTILTFDRIAHINSALLTKFPLLEYMTARAPRPDGGVTHRWTIDDYRKWLHMFDGDDHMNCEPTAGVDHFMWKYVLPSDPTQNRINKALRNAQDLDHDDMFAYLPPASEQVLMDACKAFSGQRKALTYEGYANAAPGFSQYFKSLAENDNRYKMVQAFRSYMRFESIMMTRYDKSAPGYARLDRDMLDNATICSAEPPKLFFGELNTMFRKVVYAYGNQKLIDNYELCIKETGDLSDPKEKADQDKIQYAFQKFGDLFQEVMNSDKGEKMLAIVRDTELTGIKFSTNEQKIKMKNQAVERSVAKGASGKDHAGSSHSTHGLDQDALEELLGGHSQH